MTTEDRITKAGSADTNSKIKMRPHCPNSHSYIDFTLHVAPFKNNLFSLLLVGHIYCLFFIFGSKTSCFSGTNVILFFMLYLKSLFHSAFPLWNVHRFHARYPSKCNSFYLGLETSPQKQPHRFATATKKGRKKHKEAFLMKRFSLKSLTKVLKSCHALWLPCFFHSSTSEQGQPAVVLNGFRIRTVDRVLMDQRGRSDGGLRTLT